jgi:predicted Zn finger-like uncharacterized protein
MIVKCASCQTRFKIGDEKVTVRGVKVRCTKCGTIFRVSKDPPAEAPLSSAATPLEDLVGPPSPAEPPPPEASSDALADIFQSMVPDPTGAGQDRPSTAAGQDRPRTNAGQDRPRTGAGQDRPYSAGADLPPENGAEPSPSESGDAHDPFSLIGQAFGAEPPPVVRPRGNGKSPLETLASLDDPFDLPLDPLGKNKTPMPATANPPLEDDPFAAFAAGAAATAAATNGHAGAGAPIDLADPLAGLDLDPGRASMPAPPVPADAHLPEAAPWGSDALDLDTAATEPKARAPSHPSSPGIPPTAGFGGETTKVVGNIRTPSQAGQDLGEGMRPAVRSKQETPVATRVINGLASVSTVLLALLIFVLARNGGHVDLRDPGSAFLAAFGVHRPVPVSQSLPALISGSGIYRSESGLPVLFVRGSVQNLTERPQRLRVRLTVEDSGRVAAESEAWPSLVPTPDELYAVRTSADLKQLQRGWDDHEPTPLIARGTADFMVVTADLPTNLGSLLLKVVAVPQTDAPSHVGPSGAGAGAVPPARAAGAAAAPKEVANRASDGRPALSEQPAAREEPAPRPASNPTEH